MILRSDPKYPSRRTYVLKLHADATSAQLSGRLENLATTEHADFDSYRELVDLLASDLANASPPSEDC